MVNTHKLKDKQKNINRQLGSLYKKKQDLQRQISELETARSNNKYLLHIKNKREQNKK